MSKITSSRDMTFFPFTKMGVGMASVQRIWSVGHEFDNPGIEDMDEPIL